ncbi:hypothetical protein ACB098_11G183000 [Castanea mollissima]
MRHRHSMPSSCMSLNGSNSSQSSIDSSQREVRLRTAPDIDVSLGHFQIRSCLREYSAHSAGRDSISSTEPKVILFNLERGEEEDNEEEEEGTKKLIDIVSCKGFKLTICNHRDSSRLGNRGMEVILGQLLIRK